MNYYGEDSDYGANQEAGEFDDEGDGVNKLRKKLSICIDCGEELSKKQRLFFSICEECLQKRVKGKDA